MHVGIANPRWRGKRSQHSRRMRNPQIYVSGKRSISGGMDYTLLTRPATECDEEVINNLEHSHCIDMDTNHSGKT